MAFDYDYIVIGSGFGGSVSAMRLTEKGYSVAVMEAGDRFQDKDFPKSNWNLKRYAFFPKLGLRGIMRYTLLPNVMIVHGAGVGGGSLVYANTLYEPGDAFFNNGSWSKIRDWKQALKPHYETARRMLGVTASRHVGPGDTALRDTVEEMFGRGDTFKPTPVAVYFGKPGQEAADPYFGGEGPNRTGCTFCGGCMTGCRVGAKNTLVKNYLYFAERQGAKVLPGRTVIDIKPLPEGGYAITHDRTGAWFRKDRQVLRCRGVVMAAGVLGSVKLLMTCKASGSLPNISDRLGHRVCTNSESILGVTARDDKVDYSKGLAISASVYPEEHTHLEVCRFREGADLNSLLAVYLTGGGNKFTRPFKFIWQFFRHPIDFLRVLWPVGWARRSSLILAMQSLESYIRLIPKRGIFGKVRLSSKMEKGKEIPSYIPLANQVAERMAEKINGIPQSSLNEVLLNVPVTAHILGGAGIGDTPETGVIDGFNRMHGYENFYVCDGSMIPTNLGVNPSLTITAMTEHAMSHIPAKQTESPQETEVAYNQPEPVPV